MRSDQAELLAMKDPQGPPPLTRNGYTRSARADRDISDLQDLPRAALIAAFAYEDEAHPSYRCAEALVSFVRRAHRDSDRHLLDRLFSILVQRSLRLLRSVGRGLDEDARYEIQAEVLADMARLLLAKDDAGDFLEVRFWLYLRRKAITSRAALLRARRRLPLVDDLVGGDEEQASAILSVPSGDLSPEDRVLLKDGLARLPPELRELMILRYLEGWRVGDELPGRRDPNDPTLSERYAITPRAVRKRLARAEAFLTDSKGTPHAN